MAEEASERLRLTVKTTKEKIEVDIPSDYTVKQLKDHLVGIRSDFPVAQLCLIFAGHILKDEETLESQGVKSNVTIHLVIRSGLGHTRPQQSRSFLAARSTTAQSQSGASGTGTGPVGSLGVGLGGLGMGAGAGGDLQSQMMQAQQQLMSNPELMQQLMESPLMQSLLANPDTLQSMLTSNPQIQQLMERNPELTHILHNPELMRQAMEMARNPAAMREMMRSQDRQLSNIESIPGGFNALARMYHEIQEPMMDAAQESIQQQMQNNPFSALFNQQQSTPNPGPSTPQGTPNTAPLPNPWAGGSSTPRTTGASSTRTVPTTSTTTSSVSGSSSVGTSGGGSSSTSGGGSGSTSGGGSGSTSGGPPLGGAPGGLAGLGGVSQQMMQQMMSNPEMFSQVMQMHNQMQQSEGGEGGGMAMPDPQIMAQMMQNPVYQQMMQQMMSNPQVIEQVMRNHPLLASNPNAAEVARQSTQMMQGEEFRQLMSNPEALGAMMQIQQGMMRLQATSPGVLSASGQARATGSSQQPTGGGGAGGVASAANTGGGVTQDMLQQMLSQITPPTSQGGNQGQPTTGGQGVVAPPSGGQGVVAPPSGGQGVAAPPSGGQPAEGPAGVLTQQQQAEVLYQSQLEQLANMGFPDRQRNITALIETGGDLNAAVNRLIQ